MRCKMKKIHVYGMILIIFMLFLLLPTVLLAGSSWVPLTLDDGGAGNHNLGLFTDMALDNNNKLHISYHDSTDGNLRYATNASGSWDLQDADLNTNFVGQYTSIAVDNNNKAHISYIDETNHTLKYATNAGGSWQSETVDSTFNINFETSIAIDKNGLIHISYYDNYNQHLKHAYGSFSSWTKETVDNSPYDTGRYSSIAVDSWNNVYISYYDATNGNLLYARNEDGWLIGPIDDSDYDVGQYSSMVIDGNDTLHVSYYDATNKHLKYAQYSDGWQIETIDFYPVDTDDIGQFSSIAIDSLHNVWISCYDASTLTLKYASGKYGSWSTGQIDSTAGVGQYSAIVLDHTNRVHVSYYDTNNGGELKYASNGYSLAVTKSATGSGVVMSDPPGINCGTPADCNEIYGDNTIVTIKAIPDAGSYFTGWSGCASSTMICKVKMNAALNVNATFDIGLPPVTTWVKTYGDVNNDESSSIQQTSDGGFVVAGVKDIGTGIGDAWVMKLYQDGTIDWQKTYANSYTDEARSIQQTSDGGFIISGETGFNGFGTGDIWILKLDAGGNITWEKAYGDEDLSGIQEIANSIKETFDGGYIVAGKTSGDIWILKLDQDGDLIWQKSYGSEGLDNISDIQQTGDGGYIAAGETADSVLALKLDAFGNIIWGKSYSNIYYSYSSASSIRQTTDGGYIVAGLNSFSGDYDIWVLKLDSNGNVGPDFSGTWQKSYGTTGHDEAAASVRQTTDGGFIVAGNFSDNIWVLKLSQNGDVSWQYSYSSTSTSTDYASSIEQTRDGFIISGTTYDVSVPEDFFLLKIDKNGDVNGCPIISTPMYPVNQPSSISVSNSSLYWASTSITPFTTGAIVTNTGVSPFTICSGPLTYPLNVVKSGTGTGTVVSSEATAPLINCGTKCTYAIASYPRDSQVKLKASADAGSVFEGWSNDCSGKGDCNLVMNATKVAGAKFVLNTLTISTQAGQGGQGGSISPTVKTVNYGETALFTVTPDDGYHIASVSGCDEGGVIAAKKKKKNVKGSVAGEVYITGPITADCTVSASFAINTFTVTPIAGEHGSMTPLIPQTVDYNRMASFDIAAEEGYHIESVSGCGGTAYTAAKKKKKKKLSAVLDMTYTTGHITESCTVAASFAINTFTVTPKAGAHGSIDPSAPRTVTYNEKVSFKVTPVQHYHIASVTGCEGSLSGNDYTTGNITGDCTVEASFAEDIFTATIHQIGGSGTITGSGISCEGNTCSGSYGAKLLLKIKPDAGLRVVDVKINGVSLGAVTVLTIKQMISNYSIDIIFGPISP
jgi:hypothetical protein